MTPAKRIVSVVESWVGASLTHRGDELRRFLARGVDDPRNLVDAHTSTCGLFALAVWHAIGLNHELLRRPYIIGKAPQWITLIAGSLGLVHTQHAHGAPHPGALLHYYSPRPSLDDHFEFLLAASHSDGVCPAHPRGVHAGGGRPNCAITREEGNVYFSLGRPLQKWYSVDEFSCATDIPPLDEAGDDETTLPGGAP